MLIVSVISNIIDIKYFDVMVDGISYITITSATLMTLIALHNE